MGDDTYNGWANYETWLTKLWMDNDQGSCEYWEEAAQECCTAAIENADDPNDDEDMRLEAVRELADRLESEHSEAVPETVGLFADLLNAAMGRVDWREIAHSLIDDANVDWSVAVDSDAE